MYLKKFSGQVIFCLLTVLALSFPVLAVEDETLGT